MIDAVPLNVASIMSIYVGHPLEPSTSHPTSSMRIDGMNWENTLVNPKCKCDYSRASSLSQGGYTVASCGVNRSGQTRQSDYRWHAQTVDCCTVRADFFLDEEIQWQQERGLFDHSSMFRVAVRIKACASWLSSSSPLHPNPLLHTYRTINHLSRIAGMSTSRTVTKRVLSVETEEVRGTIQFILMEGHILKPLSA